MRHVGSLWLALMLLLPVGAEVYPQTMNYLLQGVPSAEAQGMAAISSTLMTENALGTSYNAGYLGVYSETHFLNAGTYLSAIPISGPLYSSEALYEASAINAGINLDRLQETSLPISIGVGYSRRSISGGKFLMTGAWSGPPLEFEESERSNMYSIGIAVDYFVQLGIGVTYKDISVAINQINAPELWRNYGSNGTALDFGVFLRAPILDLLTPAPEEGEISTPLTKPFLDITTSYNLQNVGPGMEYTDADLPDPFPRNATMGLCLKFGIISPARFHNWEIVSLTAAREANDLLESWHSIDTSWFPGGFYSVNPRYSVYGGTGGAIQVIDNVLLGQNNGKVEIRSGLQLNLGEVLFVRLGSIEHGIETMSASGFGIHLAGVWQLIGRADSELLDGGVLGFLGNHVDLQFDYADVRSHEIAGKDLTFKSLNIIVR